MSNANMSAASMSFTEVENYATAPVAAPLCAMVRDIHGHHVMFLDTSFGYSRAIHYAGRFQYGGPTYHVKRILADRGRRIVLGGSAVTVHVDHQLRRFQFSPAFMSACPHLKMLEHVINLPECDITPPDQPASATNMSQSIYTNVGDSDHCDVVEPHESSSTRAAPAHIKRPRNQWIIYRSEKSKELHQRNPGMSAGEVSTEVSRQWKMEAQEVKAYYQALADEEAREHKLKYPEYRYKPGQN